MIDSFRGTPLSNFYLRPFPVYSADWEAALGLSPTGISDSYVFATGEHMFHSLKDKTGDTHLGPEMSPSQAKKAGRRMPLREDWMDVRVDMMRFVIESKFFTTRYGDGKYLVETGDEELVEGNSWGDTFWGVANPGSRLNPGQLFTPQGENWLGRLLMERREQLRAKPKTRLEVIKAWPVWVCTDYRGEVLDLFKTEVVLSAPEGEPSLHAHVYMTYAQAKKESRRIMGMIPDTVQTISFER